MNIGWIEPGVRFVSGNHFEKSSLLFHFLNSGYCDTRLASNPNYLDLGGALAAFGLIFAAYQLRKSKWDVVLRIRDAWQRNLFWILGGVGLLISLARVLLTQISSCYLIYPLNNPIFYEVVAYLFFIASPLSLIYLATRTKELFTAKNSRKFYEVMVQEVAQSNDERLNAALEILLDNFDDICKAASQYRSNNDVDESARAILDVILSDESMVRLLTTKRLDALQYIFVVIKKYNINRGHSGVGIPKIVRNLFSDKESFLYKQLDRTGLALSSNIYRTIFESPVILTNFDLFGYPTVDYTMRENFGLSGINVFVKSLSKSIETYLKTGYVPARHINEGISYLSEMFGGICLNLGIEEGRGVDTKYNIKDEWWSLHKIASFLGHDYVFLGHDEELNKGIVETEKIALEADLLSNKTINAAIAAAIYKAFEQLTYIEKTKDTYHTVLELLHGMVYEGDLKEGYRIPFEKRIWEQIGHNIVERYYPATLKTYLIFIGFCLTSKDERKGWIGEQTERMRRLLYVDLKPLLDKNEKMVDEELMKDALLPDLMKYENNQFTYTLGLGKGVKTLITPPPAGSKSALEGVDLKNSKSLL